MALRLNRDQPLLPGVALRRGGTIDFAYVLPTPTKLLSSYCARCSEQMGWCRTPRPSGSLLGRTRFTEVLLSLRCEILQEADLPHRLVAPRLLFDTAP
jgi:hypothetical protein